MAERKRERAKTSGTPASIREALKKATTEMLVLFVLRHKSMYTYEMMQEIDRMSAGKITFNTLYQAIYRLQSFRTFKRKVRWCPKTIEFVFISQLLRPE